MVHLLKGGAFAAQKKSQLRRQIKALVRSGQRPPGLAVIIVGDDPASVLYVSLKEQACQKAGMYSEVHRLGAETTEDEVLDLIQDLNAKTEIDGILVQLPLPKSIRQERVLEAVVPSKDVDGLGSCNQGKVELDLDTYVPCTPLGIIQLLDHYQIPLSGKLACVVGLSPLVGGPLLRLLINRDATVIGIHAKTLEPHKLACQADILVVATGQYNLVDEKWIKEGAVVVDVGIHRINSRTVGDVNYEAAVRKARAITPVPGGVGPMTIACLLENCYKSYTQSSEIRKP